METNMNEIKDIYSMLDFSQSTEVKLEGIRLASKITDLSVLIQPPAPPSVWEECATILSSKSDDALEPYLVELLEWLQDLNWPGATTILERLKRFSGKKLAKPFISCFFIAKKKDNNEGEIWLYFLSELLNNSELTQELSIEVVEDLKKRYNNWEMWDDE